MFRFIVRVVILLALFGVTGAFAHAQEDLTTYVVTSRQSVNARTCPRLNCAVARTFGPGAELAVVDIAQGDTVGGSDQWLQIDDGGNTLYVHSSLAAPSPKSSGGKVAGRASVNTGDWVTHTGESFTLETPRGWIDFSAIFSDEQFITGLGQFLGEDPEEFRQTVQDMCGGGACDLMLVDVESNGAALFMMHEDLEGLEWSVEMWKVVLAQQFEESGADVISAEVVELPAGQAVRIAMRNEVGPSEEMEYVVYAVMADDWMYLLIFTMDPSGAEDYTPVIDGIAASLRVTPQSTDDQALLGPIRQLQHSYA